MDMDMDEKSSLLVSEGKDTVQLQENASSEMEEEDNSRARDLLLESYLKVSGVGFFHVLLLLVVGLATAADAVEVFSVSFVLPIAEQDLDLTTAEKGWLIASIFMGMFLGSYVWGSIADVCGRKITLMTAMLWNGVCGLVSAFSPNFAFFLAFRLASGIGVGGSIPVVFSYVSEFFTEKQGGPIVILIAGCWQPGTIFTAFMAWALMGTVGPQNGINFYIGSLHFVSWRLFLIICTLPAFLSSTSVLFLPESPAYLLNAGKLKRLSKVLEKIRKVNLLCPCCVFKQPQDNNPLSLTNGKFDITMTELPADRAKNSGKNQMQKKCPFIVLSKLKQVGLATISMFRLKYLRATVLLLIIWFIQMFSYYGLQLWFPEYFKRFHNTNCPLNHTIIETHNCTGNMTNLQFYQDTLYVALAALPGNIAGVLLINVLGGRIQTALATILSAASVFAIWGVPNNHAALVGVSCLFSAVTVTVFGALNVVNIVIYDIELRSTAFGVLSGVGRVGAIVGNVIFGHLLDVDKGIPILIVASLLTFGALCAVLLPSIYRAENRPPLERLLYRIGKRIKLFLQESI